MIPLREQEIIRERFTEALKGAVKLDFFTRRPTPVFVPGREDCPTCPTVEQILRELSHLSPKIELRVHELGDDPAFDARYGIDHVPATVVRGVVNRPLVLYGLPTERLFPLLVEWIILVSGDLPSPPPAVKRKLKRLKRPVQLEVFTVSHDEQSVIQAQLASMVMLCSPHLRLKVIEAADFPKLVQERGVEVAPTTIVDGRVKVTGPLPPEALVDQVIEAAEHQALAARPHLITGMEARSLAGVPIPRDQPQATREQGTVRPSGLIVPGR